MNKNYITELIEMSNDALNCELESIEINEFREKLKKSIEEYELIIDMLNAEVNGLMNIDYGWGTLKDKKEEILNQCAENLKKNSSNI